MSETQKIDDTGAALAANVTPFIIKTCVVAAVATACTIFAAEWIIGSAEESFARSVRSVQQTVQKTVQETVQQTVQQGSIGGRKFWGRLEEELDRAAAPASDLPPERKQKLINNVRILAARWRPLIDALQDGRQAPAATASETGK